MDKRKMTETDISTKFITPAIVEAGWDLHTQIKQEYFFTDGRILVRKKLSSRGTKKRVDYLLSYKSNLPLAIIEAKDNNHSIGSGMQQAIEYSEGLKHAKSLDIPYVYASNGDGFLEHDMITGKERLLSMDEFPSPEELWKRYREARNMTESEAEIVTQEYFFKQGSKSPRYYQRIAINRAVEAIAKGQDRVLLVMATGTGKTYTAFQIIWRLWKTKAKKRILFLADRNILIDQTMTGDFKDFSDKMIKINRNKLSKAHEIYLGLYQSMTGEEDWQQAFRQFSPDFFDLIIIDECHRGSTREDSAWREILTYFNGATHVGLTATPKETKDASNITYFGEPVFTYSLKQGIEDGFLAPYKVMRMGLDKDLMGFRPEFNQVDKFGNLIEDREYNVKDFDKNIILEKRTNLVAKEISDFLKKYNRFAKTIVFCVDIDHAERMRQALVNENSDLVAEDSKYIMRITGDNEEGKAQLENFIDPNCKYPVITTTSKLMTTGVDAKTCQLIVLDSNITSMTEFKQIIGRGTRIDEEHGKTYFTIMDFRGVTSLFADSTFDGEPIVIIDPENPDDEEPIEEPTIVGEPTAPYGEDDKIIDGDDWLPSTEKRKKYYVDKVEVTLINKIVSYIDINGKLISESVIDYTKKNLKTKFVNLDDFLQKWNQAEKKQAVIDELQEQGVFFDDLKDEVGKDLDEFDMILHLAFDMKPLTKQERINNVKKRNYFTKYSEQARNVLDILLEKYQSQGIKDIEGIEVLKLDEFKKIASPIQIVNYFGGKDKYLEAVRELEKELYA
ncbi:MAG: DEAD/DEAH box helicase family protein [Acetoanaerobium sp.]|nr:DEAD/DEAH box helicase family protein [Acetoanaerobium sp.]